MENIAVVGIANLFPGSNTPEQFWQQLLDKKDNRAQITAAELGVDPAKYYGKKGDTDKFYCMYGGYIRAFEFDAAPFTAHLDKEYLNQLDALNQWGLYVTEQALKDAGYWASDKLHNCGLILGNLSFPTKSSNQLFLPLYAQVVENALKQLISPSFQLTHFTTPQAVLADNGLIAGYPSALFAKAAGLGGAHFSLDAACASSCYSIKLACDYLHTGKADMMLAGAVSAADPLFVNMGFSIFQAFPENNRHAPFDQNSQGLFAAEGAGMMVLKRHSDALRDGDKIHAIIKGGALSNDGKGEFVLSPNSKGQILAYQRAYQDAQLSPGEVDYIECHATGTPKGDKVELSSMETFFSAYQAKPLLGSAKSNLGHLLTAAGMPGMTKAIWALNSGKIPATISLENPIVSKAGYFSAAQLPTATVNWPINKGRTRTAGVSVFGFGGSNAHLILQPGNTPFIPNSVALNPRQPLAIVGMDCVVGSAANLGEFNELINSEKNGFRELPINRWKGMDKSPAILATLNLSRAPKGAYIENFEIDFLRFKVPPNDQDALIAQQLLMMKVADNAAQDAGLIPGSNVAVLVAMGVELDLHQYRGRVNLATQIEQSLREQGIELTAAQQEQLIKIAKASIAAPAQLNQYTSFIGNIMASRIAALWDFSGPAFSVSSEENSVYRCVELAETLLQTSDLDAVIIASVDLAGSLENISLRQRYGPVSEDSSPADILLDAQHWLVGEGAGAFVVKPSAKVAGEEVYATIDGCAFSAGSDAEAIAKSSAQACKLAGIKAADITHIEAFASGFSADNQAEKEAFSALYPHGEIDSVKRQVGHLFNASGMVSIIKSALLLNQQKPRQHRAINGLGRDLCCAHLLLSSTLSARLAPVVVASKKPFSLVKKITLGGAHIEQAILDMGEDPLFKAIQAQLSGRQLNPVTNPADLGLLKINSPMQYAAAINERALNSTNNTASSGVKMNSTTSENSQQTQIHQAFIRARQVAEQQIAALIKLQAELTAGKPGELIKPPQLKTAVHLAQLQSRGAIVHAPLPLVKPAGIIYDSADLLEFAEGKIGKVFGPAYQIIDSYPRRVRLPTTDYLLVSRVTKLDATLNEYRKSSMVTEYDIPTDAPFLIDGQIPWCVSVESGQCDLMLISYIGIDLQNRGERVYRLLDCELTFLDKMAFGGETLRYEIHIDSYARNGEQLLFFFHYDCYVGDKKVLIMRKGCAGFFTDQELAEGKGVIHSDKDRAQFAAATKSYFQPLIFNSRSHYGFDEMMKLVKGDLSGCFGAEYDQQGRNPSLKFSSEKFLMIERITKIDPQGGHWGLGLVEGQKDIEPDHWYFPCHFKDDQVMAGSLMSEGCGQMAMFFMLWLGMSANVNNGRFQPMAGQSQTVRCRGQVTPQSNTLTYRMEVTEIGISPRPFIKANIDILLDGKVVVDFKNLCVEIQEQDKKAPSALTLPAHLLSDKAAISASVESALSKLEKNPSYAKSIPYALTLPVNQLLDNAAISASVELAFSKLEKHARKRDKRTNPQLDTRQLVDERGVHPFKHPQRPLMRVESDWAAPREKGVVPIKHFPAPLVSGQNRVPDSAPFTPWHLFEFATGNISNCFGPDFDIYSTTAGRIPPRTPCGDLQLVTQVVEVQGTRLDFKNPASCICEYYVPSDAWYYTNNSHPNWIPYAVIMEIALQPNGFISGYMGSTLKYPHKDLFFRNLDGSGELLKQIDLRGKTIVNRSLLLSTSMAGGAIIQSFTFELLVEGETFYKGKAVFGYFSAESLTNQLGIDNGKLSQAWFVDNNTPNDQIERFYLTDKTLPFLHAKPGKPYYRLAGGQLNFVDTISIVEGGGKAQLAYIYGERRIDLSDWFFRYHFHQDPVMPGSLGVEAIIELLQTYALKNDLGAQFTSPRFIAPLSNVIWKYRGQITPLNQQMTLDVHITEIIRSRDEVRLVGDANLCKDGLRIYEVKNIVLSIVEA